MNGKIVLITGANGGLGNFVTRRFLEAGASVIGVSTKISDAEFPSPGFHPISADLTQPTSVNGVVNDVIKRFGRLDILVHVLGGFAGGKSIADTDDATWERMQSLNLTSAFYVLRAAIPHLRKASHGRIIAIGSLAANSAHAGLGAYVTFKSALNVLIQTVALENKDAGVTANIILPGTMDTPANRKAMPKADFSAWLSPARVADLALYLAQDEAAHITGASLPIDGTDSGGAN